jgi:hypothetical protein
MTYFGADMAQPRCFSSMAVKVFSLYMKIFFIFGKMRILGRIK